MYSAACQNTVKLASVIWFILISYITHCLDYFFFNLWTMNPVQQPTTHVLRAPAYTEYVTWSAWLAQLNDASFYSDGGCS